MSTVRESAWFQYQVYPSGRCVAQVGCGDMTTGDVPGHRAFCAAISRHGYDYRQDYPAGVCPKTYSIVGVMSWHDPRWGPLPEHQNGTFPFNRDSTAFALDYLGAFLRGCQEGWLHWLGNTGDGSYAAGEKWGCVGAWYAGSWLTPPAREYVGRVRAQIREAPADIERVDNDGLADASRRATNATPRPAQEHIGDTAA